MIKRNKLKLIISSLIILLPIAAGLLLWNELPGRFVTHWNAQGEGDATMGKVLAVFLVPCVLLLAQWLCIFITVKDPKNKDQDPKVFGLVLLIMPFLSLVIHGIMYSTALGISVNMKMIMFVLLGIMFLIIGNYMPKCRQNRTIGIKLPWTYSSEEIWNRTHRFSGKVWVACGFAFVFCAFLPNVFIPYALIALVVVSAVIPTVYSLAFYKKQVKEGVIGKDAVKNNSFKVQNKVVNTVVIVLVILIIAGAVLLMFTGNISLSYGESSFEIKASYQEDITVDYTSVDSIEYREDGVGGNRVYGFGSPRLLMGTFENEEFGTYTRYTYTKSGSCVVLTSGDNVLVLSGKTETETKAIYDSLCEKIGK